jgi:hypothetical protein
MPFYRFEIEASMSPNEVAQRIGSVTCDPAKPFDRPEGFRQGRGSNLFWGSVRGNSFSLRRNINYRNSFLPLIRGRITQSGVGSTLRVVMFMNPGGAAFHVFCFLAIAGFLIAAKAPSLMFWWMVLGGLALPAVAFFPEAIEARGLISSLVREGTPQPIQ